MDHIPVPGEPMWLPALTIYSSMTGFLDPKLITWWSSSLDEATAKELQDAVSRTVLETFESRFITYPWTTSWTAQSPSASPSHPPTCAWHSVASAIMGYINDHF
ncbi:expressed unknown protein [Seminavis robusta]|uniref:Uncharacterized protein n=1 Tax=Seminavis robusta TaxID=568900 RepID=A0A9N8HI71_9STRA|nr:expressed unknown protein [Seminavis robusta]|eukprot:Sro484_g152230.1 n/a (104) ;mRNA; r:21525-21836